jgi:hypothetical protein
LTLITPSDCAALKIDSFTDGFEPVEKVYLKNVTINGGRHALLLNAVESAVVENSSFNPAVGGGVYVGVGTNLELAGSNVGAASWGPLALSIGIAYDGGIDAYSIASIVALDEYTYDNLGGFIFDEANGAVSNSVAGKGVDLYAIEYNLDGSALIRIFASSAVDFSGGAIAWYSDENLSEEYDFDAALTGGAVIYGSSADILNLIEKVVADFFELIDDDGNEQNNNLIGQYIGYDFLWRTNPFAVLGDLSRYLKISPDGAVIGDIERANILNAVRTEWKKDVDKYIALYVDGLYYTDDPAYTAAYDKIVNEIIAEGIDGGKVRNDALALIGTLTTIDEYKIIAKDTVDGAAKEYYDSIDSELNYDGYDFDARYGTWYADNIMTAGSYANYLAALNLILDNYNGVYGLKEDESNAIKAIIIAKWTADFNSYIDDLVNTTDPDLKSYTGYQAAYDDVIAFFDIAENGNQARLYMRAAMTTLKLKNAQESNDIDYIKENYTVEEYKSFVQTELAAITADESKSVASRVAAAAAMAIINILPISNYDLMYALLSGVSGL